MKKLPIGISSFEEIRTEGYYYVDKTHFVKKLVDEGKYYFLSRPRRFGKSLFVDTLKSAFEGKRELFTGLYLENNWNWNQNYPVVRISFDQGKIRSSNELEEYIKADIKFWSKIYEIDITEKIYYKSFFELVYKIYQKTRKKVVLLVDEYDKPILDNIEKKETAAEIREVLKGFYQTIKGIDQYLKFVFITGISKFAKISLFSGLNQLEDISLNQEYGDLCGYTEKELLLTFGERIKEQEIEGIRNWYNGYWWLSSKIYNPFDVLLYLKNKSYSSYWYETGNPEVLIKLIKHNKYEIPNLELMLSEEDLNRVDVDKISIEALMFQTGYLTIHKVKEEYSRKFYKLKFPNKEVQISFNENLLREFLKDWKGEDSEINPLRKALENFDTQEIEFRINKLLENIPYDLYGNDEKSIKSFLYVYLYSTGFECNAELHTKLGRIDIILKTPNKKIYIFEIKIDKDEEKALKQIKNKEYYAKYTLEENVIICGMNFNTKKRKMYYMWETIYR